MKNHLKRGVLALAASLGLLFSPSFSQAGNLENIVRSNQDEPGFIPPPPRNAPPPPPSHIASAETYIPYPGPPAAPMARSEKKNPPNPPVLMTRINQDSNLDLETPNAVNGLLKGMKSLMNVNYSAEVKSISELDVNPEKNPILIWSRHYRFDLTERETKILREYLINGGTLVMNPGRGSKPAYDSAVQLAKIIFPEVNVSRLSPDHPLLHAYYDLETVAVSIGNPYKPAAEAPKVQGATLNCRTAIIIPERGLDAGFANENIREIDRVFMPESAQKLGINITAYSTAQRAWQKGVAHALSLTDANNITAGKIGLTQIVYDGEWKTRHKGLSMLLHQFNQKTDIPVKYSLNERTLADSRIFDSPVLYMTGHENFVLKKQEIENLRKYLLNGGTLVAEACCGRAAFDGAFRREMQKVLPEFSFNTVKSSDPLYTLPNKINAVGITKALEAQLGKSLIDPKIEEVIIKNHPAVIYSPYGLQGGWELASNPYGLGYDDPSSIALGENILLSTAIR